MRPLSPRQRRIADLVGLGRSNAEIAHALNTTEQCVKNALGIVYDREDVRDRVALALKVQEARLRQEWGIPADGTVPRARVGRALLVGPREL